MLKSGMGLNVNPKPAFFDFSCFKLGMPAALVIGL
jgi:hypothetical protein